ncbi:MAG TPA: hypothetical protein VFU31_08560 [Candidatus Binatia bacterium]|nr:hypothetical protein [Candidatus Binatia bacterium]
MKAKIAGLLGSDAVLPEQFFDTMRRTEHFEPEKNLLLAILEDAIHNYRKYSLAHDRVGRERFAEAEHWIMHAEDDWIFSFVNVCELLGLDPEHLRRGLRDWRAKMMEQEKSSRSSGSTRHAA